MHVNVFYKTAKNKKNIYKIKKKNCRAHVLIGAAT